MNEKEMPAMPKPGEGEKREAFRHVCSVCHKVYKDIPSEFENNPNVDVKETHGYCEKCLEIMKADAQAHIEAVRKGEIKK